MKLDVVENQKRFGTEYPDDVEVGALRTYTGVVTRVGWTNNDSTWATGRFERTDGPFALFTVTGEEIVYVQPGVPLKIVGKWSYHSQWGYQFQVIKRVYTDPKDERGLVRYLALTMPDIGEHLARLIVGKFGLQTLRIIDEEPEKLKEIDGIGQKRMESLVEARKNKDTYEGIMIELFGLGFRESVVEKAIGRWGKEAANVVKENPYILIDLYGVGFKTADQAAVGLLGLPADSPFRLQAALVFSAGVLTSKGHCYVEPKVLIKTTLDLVNVPVELLQEQLDNIVQDGRLVLLAEDQTLCLPHILRAEREVAAACKYHAEQKYGDAFGELARMDITLDRDQERAVRLAFERGIVVVTGGPGTGKTTIVNEIVSTAALRGLDVSLCAPTGRAARRLSETTKRSAYTIHKLLGWHPADSAFTHNAENPLRTDLLVVDESSMVDILLMWSLLLATEDTTRIVLVGDVDQLPSVGPGAVLRDVIDSGVVPVVRLTHIYRQVEDSQIVWNAHRLLENEDPKEPERLPDDATVDFKMFRGEEHDKLWFDVLREIMRGLPARFPGIDLKRDLQVIVPVNRKRFFSVDVLNKLLQDSLNPLKDGEPEFVLGKGQETRFRLGDRVMQQRNDYDSGVVNGEIGYVRDMNLKDRILVVEFDFDDKIVEYGRDKLNDIRVAYACTVHKAQGSEFPVVAAIVHHSHSIMAKKRLLYTAITRGREFVILGTNQKALDIAFAVWNQDVRNTHLRQFLERAQVSDYTGGRRDDKSSSRWVYKDLSDLDYDDFDD